MDESQIAYEKAKAAKAPPKEYVSTGGQKAKIDPHSPSTRHVRDIPQEQYANRTVIIEKHYHNHYGPRYDYYRSQPPIYIGGGYSSLFWYAMLDWDIHRQAMWMYNNEQRFLNGELNRDLYEQRLQNATLKAEVDKLRAQKMAQDPNYIDPEFKESPVAMYDENFVKTVRSPEVVVVDRGGFPWGWFVLALVCGTIFIGWVIWFVFVRDAYPDNQ